MPAVIFNNSFRGRGVPAWHGIGEVFNDDPTARTAFELAGLDYMVEKTPIYADIPGKGRIELPDQYAVIREAVGQHEAAFLAVVGREFKPVQNMAIADAIDASGLLEKYQIETVGALGNGETIFTALSDRDGEYEIAGSPLRDYWTAYNGHDGNRALGFMHTPVKTVCSNTLVMALQAATISAKISHGATAETDFKFWLSVAPQLKAAQLKTREAMQTLAKFEVTDEQVDEILEAAYPRPKVIGKAQLKNLVALELDAGEQGLVDKAVDANSRAALRQFAKLQLAKDIFTNYINVEGEKGQAGTAWGVYEAVCDVEDHREPSRRTENQFESALFGPRARSKKDAFAAAAKVALVSLK
jgi:phage/plasmid-like protein (TIGR03299 family)